MLETTGSDPSRGLLQPDHLSTYVLRTFRHTLRGYNPADVDAHLRLVRGWFTLAGFEQLLADRHDEIFGSALRNAETTVENARREAAATIEQARLEAAATTERARRESDAMIERARRESETVLDQARRRVEATTAVAEQRLASIKTLASAILEESDARS
jgi:DivIVA domain-containing protein